MVNILWPALIVGIVVVVLGVLLIVFRRQFSRASQELQRDLLSGVGGAVVQRSTPFWMGVVGASAVLFGLALTLFSLLHR